MKFIKILTIIVVIIMILNIILFASRIINEFVFWTIIAIGALFSYFLKKNKEKKFSKKKK